jgi:hypothetical protein
MKLSQICKILFEKISKYNGVTNFRPSSKTPWRAWIYISGKTHNVPCVFQIWKKQENNRTIIPYPLSRFVDFVKKDENPDLSIRRVGVYAGKIDTDVDKSIQSHYFIKMKNNIDPSLFSIKYKSIEFEHDNTAGPKSISKKELIIALNKLSL